MSTHPKPIRRSIHLLNFSKDHHFLLMFCWKIRQGIQYDIPLDRILSYVAWFRDQCLQPYIKREETFLGALKNPSFLNKAVDDHKDLLHAIHQMLESSENKTAGSVLELAGRFDNYVRFQEREMFREIESQVSEDVLAAIAAKTPGQPVIIDDYRDAFWLKK